MALKLPVAVEESLPLAPHSKISQGRVCDTKAIDFEEGAVRARRDSKKWHFVEKPKLIMRLSHVCHEYM